MIILICVDWEVCVKDLKIEGCVFVNGEYSNVVFGEIFDCLSLVDGCFLVKVVSCDLVDVEQVVKVVCNVFDFGVWLCLVLVKCKQMMICFVDLLLENVEELVLLEILDMGKLISDLLYIDVVSVVNSLCWSVEVIDKIYDEVVVIFYVELGLVICELVGVVVVIVLWNFLLLMFCWKFGLVLVIGNLVIFKFFEKLLLIVICIVQLVVEVGILKGVFNVLLGYGYMVGKVLVLYMDVDILVFIGLIKIVK